MNAKLNVLEQMVDTVSAPRTKSNLGWSTPGVRRLRLRMRPNAVRRAIPAPAESLWRVTMAEARDGVAERALGWTLMAAGLAGLAWLGYTTVQFLLAWEGLVSWVRTAMM